MPILLGGRNTFIRNTTPLSSAKYPYTYPFGLKLKPLTPVHDALVTTVMGLARDSQQAMSKRYDSWKDIDKTLTAYIPTDTDEKKVIAKDSRKPISIVVPVSYATLETLLTYMVAAFLENPIFKYSGAGPEDMIGAILLEMVVDRQVRQSKMGLALHTQWRDGLAYGLGVVAPVWKKRMGYRSVTGEGGRERVPAVLFEGNDLMNIDPYMYLPDPNVPVHKVQEGEHVGWVQRTNRMQLLSEELANPSMFNCKYLAHINGPSTLFSNQSQRDRYGVSNQAQTMTNSNVVDVVYKYVNLIPKEWDLGNGQYPEKWLFGVAGDQVLIRAQPLGLDHNMFPVAVCAPDYDGYSAVPISRLEVINGLQRTMDFLYNNHFANVRKAINDILIVDPEMININDLLDPEGGILARLRKKAWGRGVKDAVMQLPVNDITRQHIPYANFVSDLTAKYSGATDGLMGINRHTSERVSATESRDIRGSALSRLEKAARVAGLQSMYDLSYMIASHTQQLMEQDQYAKILGTWAERLQEDFGLADDPRQMDIRTGQRIQITPADLLIDYDIVMPDGTLPNTGDPALWKDVLQIVASQPLLLAKLDVVRIFKHWARMSGASNVDDFSMKASVQPQEQIDAQVQQGNLKPVGGLQ